MKYKSEMAKIKKYSHNLRKVMNVFFWAAVIFAFCTAIAAVVIKFMPDAKFILTEKGISQMGFSLDGLIKYKLDMTAVGTNVKNIYLIVMIMAAVITALIIPLLRQLVLILGTIEENRPFAIENAKRISKVGVVLMIGAFAIPAVEVLVARVIIDTMKVQNIGTNYSINFALIITSFMIFVLGGIFKYGSYLQHEYDETV